MTDYLGSLTSDVVNGSATPISAVTPSASPFLFTAPTKGALNVSGGTVSAIAHVRGATTTSLGGTSGNYLVSKGDVLKITYSVAPTLLFIPL